MNAPEPVVLEVVAAVIIREGQILVCRRSLTRSAGGKWEFPGGKIENGETPELALIREIREELDIELVVEHHLSTDDTVVGDQTIRLRCYVAALGGPEPTESTDHDQMRWVGPDELAELDWAKPDLPAVRLLTRRR